MKAPSLTPAQAEAFARFMAAYPNRRPNPSAPARAKFAEALKAGEDAEALVRAAARFAAVVKAEGIEARFVPQARRWLHQREFEDYLADAPATAPADAPEPSPEHPLGWLRSMMTEAAFKAWISTLEVAAQGDGFVELVARTGFQRDRVTSDHGHHLRRRYGEVRWRIQGAAR